MAIISRDALQRKLSNSKLINYYLIEHKPKPKNEKKLKIEKKMLLITKERKNAQRNKKDIVQNLQENQSPRKRGPEVSIGNFR